jgi:hypothetical protein
MKVGGSLGVSRFGVSGSEEGALDGKVCVPAFGQLPWREVRQIVVGQNKSCSHGSSGSKESAIGRMLIVVLDVPVLKAEILPLSLVVFNLKETYTILGRLPVWRDIWRYKFGIHKVDR